MSNVAQYPALGFPPDGAEQLLKKILHNSEILAAADGAKIFFFEELDVPQPNSET